MWPLSGTSFDWKVSGFLPDTGEEDRRNKYHLDKSNQVSVEETEDKKSTDKTKASAVIEEVI